MRTEAAIVGAGPAGLIAARELARMGVEVKVFEEHQNIGEPNHCAGIISVEGLRRLGVVPSPDFVQQEVRGGTAHSPDGTSIRIRGDRTRAYAVDRAAFDRHLAGLALGEGAELERGRRVSELVVKDGRVTGIRTREGIIRAGVVVDCEGAGGSLARSLGLQRPSEGVLAGINAEVPGIDLEPDMVEVWLGNDIAPGLFAWVVPIVGGEARCGLACAQGDALVQLKAFLGRRFGDVVHSEPRIWPVLTGGPVSKTVVDGLLLVGDVAGQTKPTTGGGVILGGLCALEAAKTASEALEQGEFSAKFLGRYERSWRASLGDEFSSMLAVRRFSNKVSDARMNRLFASLKKAGLEDALREIADGGDMDMQSGVIRSALRHPGMLRVLVRSLGRLALAELRGIFNL